MGRKYYLHVLRAEARIELPTYYIKDFKKHMGTKLGISENSSHHASADVTPMYKAIKASKEKKIIVSGLPS